MDSIRTYRVRSLHEALRQIRQDLGPNAAVLHTREIPAGWFGWRSELEVTASAEISPPNRLTSLRTERPTTPTAVFSTPEQNAQPETFMPPLSSSLNFTATNNEALDRDAVVWEDREERGETGRAFDLRAEKYVEARHAMDVRNAIGANKVAPKATTRVDEVFADSTMTLRQIASLIKIAGPLQVPAHQQTIVALVGPTGVGKTTSLAKLAAEFSLNQQRSVGLITVDSYRIGAIEQLRTYAEIMRLPWEVAVTTSEMESALDRLGDCELILIDTAGRSPLDRTQMSELAKMLAVAQPHETHLVTSVVSQMELFPDLTTRYQDVGANRLLLSKTDELQTPGRIMESLHNCPLPIGYIANGQNVPADLHPANPQHLAQWLQGIRPSSEL